MDAKSYALARDSPHSTTFLRRNVQREEG